MSEVHRGEISLEQKASIYKIKVHGCTRAELATYYDTGKNLRWSLNDNFTLKIWKGEAAFHQQVDPDAFDRGKTGNFSKKYGFTLSDMRVWDEEQKTILNYAIKKFLEQISTNSQ